jgi:hypothetical protein
MGEIKKLRLSFYDFEDGKRHKFAETNAVEHRFKALHEFPQFHHLLSNIGLKPVVR